MPTLRHASLHHKVNNPPSITRCRSIKETAALALFELCEIQRRQLSIATLRREIDDIVRCAPNVIKLSLPRAAHCSGRLPPSSAFASVAPPPSHRPWRLSPLVVQWIISMSVITALLLTSSNANGCSCVSLYYVLILLVVLLYRILRPMIFIPRFAEIWGPTFICGSARALYRALVRPEGRAFFS